MTEKREIYSLEDIKFLVDKFYQKVKEMSILKGQLPKKLNGEQIKWQKCLFLK